MVSRSNPYRNFCFLYFLQKKADNYSMKRTTSTFILLLLFGIGIFGFMKMVPCHTKGITIAMCASHEHQTQNSENRQNTGSNSCKPSCQLCAGGYITFQKDLVIQSIVVFSQDYPNWTKHYRPPFLSAPFRPPIA